MDKEDDTVTDASLDEIGRRGGVIESRLEAAERSVAAADSISGIGLTFGSIPRISASSWWVYRSHCTDLHIHGPDIHRASLKPLQFQRRTEVQNPTVMRVGIFTDTYLPDCNGVTAAVSALARELAAIGHHPSIIAPAGSHTFDENFGFTHIYLPAFRHERIPLPLGWSALGWPKSQRIVNSEFDIIHAHGLGPVGVYGARVAHRLNIPLVLSIHTDVLAYVAHYPVTARLATPLRHILLYQLRKLLKTEELQGTRAGHPLEQLIRCFGMASASVIVPTEKTARKFAAYVGNAKLEVCPSGVELPRMEPYRCRRTLRTRAVVRLLYVGRITTEKGIPMLLGSVDDLISRGYNVELTLAGPIIAHSRLSRSLRLLARSGNVRLVGTLSGKDLWNQYRRADIFVFPSTTDTQGLVLHEAAHAGLPIVMVDPLLTIVSKPGLNAILCEPSVAGLTDAIEVTIKKLTDSRWCEMVEAAGRKLASQYSLSTQTRRLTKIYGRLIAESKDHAA